jgi:hypothetical protein
MTQDEFNRIVAMFDAEESMRSALYYRALNLIAAGFVIDAHILILATWNFARFRYAMTQFDLLAYEQTVESLTHDLVPLRDDDLMSVNLDLSRNLVVGAFDQLARISGIEYTGAAKILHLLLPRVFIMWDRSIMGQSPPYRDYPSLDIVKSGFWQHRKFPQSGVGYHEFLLTCRNRFRGLRSPENRKTLAKCIDEFNFCTITVPLAEMRKQAPEE